MSHYNLEFVLVFLPNAEKEILFHFVTCGLIFTNGYN